MRDIATGTLSGNLTQDVDLRALPSGEDVARLRVASTGGRRVDDEWVEKTNYFTVEVFGARAHACAEYLRKGSRVFVDAELDWREWTDQKDNRREAVTFRARTVLFADSGPLRDGNGAANANGARESSTAAMAPPRAARTTQSSAGDGSASADDLPF
jgi:single-strand DNA-binding protein